MNESDIHELARHGVATVYEAAGRTGLIDIPLVQLIAGSRVAGWARTVRCGQGDNLMVHAVMEQVQPGEILILTMPEPEPVALIGELLATRRWYARSPASWWMHLSAIQRNCKRLACPSGRAGFVYGERPRPTWEPSMSRSQ